MPYTLESRYYAPLNTKLHYSYRYPKPDTQFVGPVNPRANKTICKRTRVPCAKTEASFHRRGGRGLAFRAYPETAECTPKVKGYILQYSVFYRANDVWQYTNLVKNSWVFAMNPNVFVRFKDWY